MRQDNDMPGIEPFSPEPLLIGEKRKTATAGHISCESLSVIIPTRNRGTRILQTLQAILNNEVWPLEIIIVDQSDAQEAHETWLAIQQAASQAEVTVSYAEADPLEQIAPPNGTDLGFLRYIRCHGRGAGNSRNAGARASRGTILAFTDDDIIVDRKWLAVIEQEYKADPLIVGVYGRILPLGQDSKGKIKTYNRRDGTEVVRDGTKRLVFTRPANPWRLGSGGNMSFRRQPFLDCGQFDEVLSIGAPFMAFEDLDIGYRLLMKRAGTIIFSWESLVYHNSSKTFAEQVRTEQGYGIGVGAAVAKYLRCRDLWAWYMLVSWVWQMSIRRVAAGLVKWRNPKVVYLATLQFWYPFLGIVKAWGWPLDTHYKIFMKRD